MLSTANSFSVDIACSETPFSSGAMLTEFEHKEISAFVFNTLPCIGPSSLQSVDFIKRLPKGVFEKEYKKQLTRSKRAQAIKAIIYAAAVRQVILNEDIPLPSEEEMTARFSLFQSARLVPRDSEEINFLRGFVRAIETLNSIGFPGHNHKQVYMQVGAMLEGSKKSYATGGAPSKATQRRESIFIEVTGCGRRPARVGKAAKKPQLDEDELNFEFDLTTFEDEHDSSESITSEEVLSD